MYGWEKRVLLREYLEQGVAKGALAKKLGISRNTIHYWLKTDQLDRELDEEAVCYKKRWPAARKIGRFRGILPVENMCFQPAAPQNRSRTWSS